ncbi:MAG: hypothetical protein ACRDFW_05245 [bacterium]
MSQRRGSKKRPIKPWGFWNRPEVDAVLGAYQQVGDMPEAIKGLRALLPEGFHQSDEALAEDVRWYANKRRRERRTTDQSNLPPADKLGVERMTIGEGRRLVMPAPYLEWMGVREGNEVIITPGDGELRIRSLDQALRHARMLVRRYVPEERSLADELVAERHREAGRE